MPAMPMIEAAMYASVRLMRFCGRGLTAVRVINLSRSLSIIWLKPSDEAVTKKPPISSHANLFQSVGPLEAIKKPMPEEKTTKEASLNLVKSI